MKRKTRLLKCCLLLLLIFGLTACQDNIKGENKRDNSLDNRPEFLVSVLEQMDALIAPSSLEDSSLQNTPWIKSKVKISTLDRFVSTNVIEEYIYAYRYYGETCLIQSPGYDLIQTPQSCLIPTP